MATDIVPTLFGVTPDSYQQAQQDRADAKAMQFAQLDPFQQANYAIGRGAYGLAGAVGGALGGKDPELQRYSMRQQIAKQIDYSDMASIQRGGAALSQAGDTQGAMMLADIGRKLDSEMAQAQQRRAAAKTSLATEIKINLGVAQETKLRDELAKLPPGSDEAAIRGVLVKYGDPDKVLAALTSAATRAEDRNLKEQLAKDANEAKIEAVKVAAEAKLEAARLAGATAREIAQMRIDSARDLKNLAVLLKGPAKLAPALQKEEDKELDLVDSLEARSKALKPAIQSLTPDPVTKKSFIELGPINNMRYLAQNAAGNSTPESQAYAQLRRSVQEAINLKTDAAKGIQTDKDVLRFAETLIAAFGKNDTKTSLEALTNFVQSTDEARVNAQKRIDSRRKSQGVEPYYGSSQNPIKLD